jgi:hypothetical protein
MAEPRQPIRDSAEHRKSEFEQRSPDPSSQEDRNSSKPQLSISRTPLLIIGGVAALLILIVVIALRPSGNTPDDRLQGESVQSSVAERQTEPKVASTEKGLTQRLTDELAKAPTGSEMLYGTGIGGSSIPKSPPDSKGKEAEALYSKGEQYYSGSGVRQDYAEAARWYHKAADLNFIPAQKKLARMYSEGVGVAKDLVESLQWEIKASSQQQKELSKEFEEMDKKARDAIRHIKPG